MNQLKKALATAGTSAIVAMSMAGVAAADAVNNCQSGFELVGGACVAIDNSDHVNVDRSRDYTVNGNCSGIIFSDVDQNQNNNTDQTNVSGGGAGFVGGSNNSTNTNSNSTSQSQSAGVTFSPDCSTTNNTTVAAAPAAASAQVKAPTGGVHAGGGAGVAASSTASIAGLVSSVGSLGLGVIVRKKALLGL